MGFDIIEINLVKSYFQFLNFYLNPRWSAADKSVLLLFLLAIIMPGSLRIRITLKGLQCNNICGNICSRKCIHLFLADMYMKGKKMEKIFFAALLILFSWVWEAIKNNWETSLGSFHYRSIILISLSIRL